MSARHTHVRIMCSALSPCCVFFPPFVAFPSAYVGRISIVQVYRERFGHYLGPSQGCPFDKKEPPLTHTNCETKINFQAARSIFPLVYPPPYGTYCSPLALSALCLSPRPNPFPCGWTRHSSILYRAFPWPGGSHHCSEQRRGGDALLLPSLLHRRCCELHQISIRTRPDARYICVGGDAYTNRWANIRSLYRYITSRVVLSSSTPSCLSFRCIASLGPHSV